MPRDAPATGGLPVVTLCGSAHFRDTFARLEVDLSLAGHVVLTPTWFDAARELTDDDRALLARAHRQRIALADEVLVVDVGGYVGESTRAEIAHARTLGIPVRFLEGGG